MKPIINKYRRWSGENNKFANFLRENYLQYDNRTIAYMMGRTVDAVRKQLKKMKLKRPRKTKIRTGEPLKRGRKRREKNIFDMRLIGIQHRERIKREKEKKKKIREAKQIEKRKIEKEFPDTVIPPSPTLEGKQYIVRVINGRETLIYGNPEKTSRFAEKCNNKEKILTKKATNGPSDHSPEGSD